MNPIAEVRGARPPRAWLDAPSRPAFSACGEFTTSAQLSATGVFREGAENCARGGRAPLSISEFRLSRTMKLACGIVLSLAISGASLFAEPPASNAVQRPAIQPISPPEGDFYAKRLDYFGIVIKAPTNVVDEALFAAYDRLSMMLTNLPGVRAKLAKAGAELHIIGRDQVTTDLPEWRHDKGKPLAEYNGLTRDQRTRGMGGLMTSCGEENLLKLEKDRYRGRDICVHEFAHNLLGTGTSRAVREQVRQQLRRSLERGLWVNSYAGSNEHEFFAELAMWYFGTHGDLTMKGTKPANGPDGLKAYDPEAFALMDNFFSGRLEASAAASSTNQTNTNKQLN